MLALANLMDHIHPFDILVAFGCYMFVVGPLLGLLIEGIKKVGKR